MSKKFVVALLVCSASLNFYWWFTFHRTVPLHAICWHNSNIYHLFGEISEPFGNVFLEFPTDYSPQIYTKGRERFIRIPTWQFSHFWAGTHGINGLMNITSQFLGHYEDKHGLTKERGGPSCDRVAQWLFKPVGKAKRIDCLGEKCRIIGLKKEAGAKK